MLDDDNLVKIKIGAIPLKKKKMVKKY